MNRHEITVNGERYTRNSKNRTYTHAVVGTGRISLRNGSLQYESFLVRMDADGEARYYLGSAARTSDGWVSVPPSQRNKIQWHKRSASPA